MSRDVRNAKDVTYVLMWAGTYICKSLTLTTFPKVPSPRVASTLSAMQKSRWIPSGYEPRGPREEGVLACVHQPDGTPSCSWLRQTQMFLRQRRRNEKKKKKEKWGIAEGTRARLFRMGVRPIVRYRTRAVHGERGTNKRDKWNGIV